MLQVIQPSQRELSTLPAGWGSMQYNIFLNQKSYKKIESCERRNQFGNTGRSTTEIDKEIERRAATVYCKTSGASKTDIE